MQVICVRAHGRTKPGETVEVPDGSSVSELYFADPDSFEAKAAIAQAANRKKADAAAVKAAAADSGPGKAGPDTASSQATAAKTADTPADTSKAGA
jgi:hypothetical protein